MSTLAERARQQHEALDVAMACWAAANPGRLYSDTTVHELVAWLSGWPDFDGSEIAAVVADLGEEHQRATGRGADQTQLLQLATWNWARISRLSLH